MKSYKPEELFDEKGLRMPYSHVHALHVPSPGTVDAQDTLVLGKLLRDVAKLNQEQRNFCIFAPDGTLSNLLGAVFEATDRQWDAREIDRLPKLGTQGSYLKQKMPDKLIEHTQYINTHGQDLPKIRNWKWGAPK